MVYYTSIMGGYDPPHGDVDVCIDERLYKGPPGLDIRRMSKHAKALPHLYFPDHEWSVFIDGNKHVSRDRVMRYCRGRLQQSRHRHGRVKRDLYDEAAVCIRLGLDDPGIIMSQVVDYAQSGHPRGFGLWLCGFIVRRHHELVELGEMWWDHIMRYSSRDMISYQYCLWKLGIEPEEIPQRVCYVRRRHRV